MVGRAPVELDADVAGDVDAVDAGERTGEFVVIEQRMETVLAEQGHPCIALSLDFLRKPRELLFECFVEVNVRHGCYERNHASASVA